MTTASHLSVRIDAELAPLTTQLQAADRVTKAFGTTSVASFNMVEKAMGGVNLATARMIKGFADTDTRARVAAAGVKLTGDQMRNLTYQANDILTMWSMGMSPFAIISSQAGQVVQALGDGPGGMKGSLGAIGTSIAGLVRSVTPLHAGLAAAAAGAVYFATKANNIRPLDDVLKTHADLVSEIGQSYTDAGRAAENYGKTSASVLQFQMNQERRDLQKSLESGVQSFFEQSGPGIGKRLFGIEGTSAMEALPEAFQTTSRQKYGDDLWQSFKKLHESARDGIPDIITFRKEVAAVANMPGQKAAIIGYAKDWTNATKELEEAQRRFEDTGVRARAVQRQMEAAFERASARLGSFVPNRRTERQMVDQAYFDELGAINRLRGSDKQLDREGLRTAAALKYQAALDEIARKEADIRRGHELDMQSIFGRTAAERGNVSGERSRFAELEREMTR